MASNMGDRDEFLNGVANYLGVTTSEIENSDSGSAILESFSNNADLSQSEIENLIVDNTAGADNLDEALEQAADDWDNNYLEAFTG